MADHPINHPPEWITFVGLPYGIIFPHSGPRNIYRLRPPDLVETLVQKRFCVLAYMADGLDPKMGTLAYIESFDISSDNCIIHILPMRRFEIKEQRLEQHNRGSFYSVTGEPINETPITAELWDREETVLKQKLKHILVGVVAQIKLLVKRHKHIHGDDENTAKVSKEIHQLIGGLMLFGRCSRIKAGAAVDRVGAQFYELYATLVAMPKAVVLDEFLTLLHETDHFRRLEKLIALATHFNDHFEEVITPEVDMPEHLEQRIKTLEQQLAVILKQDFRFPFVDFMTPN